MARNHDKEALLDLLKTNPNKFAMDFDEFLQLFDSASTEIVDPETKRLIKQISLQKTPALTGDEPHSNPIDRAFAGSVSEESLREVEEKIASLEANNKLLDEVNEALTEALEKDICYERILEAVKKDFVKQQRNLEYSLELRWPNLNPRTRKVLVDLFEAHFRDHEEYIQLTDEHEVILDLMELSLIEFKPSDNLRIRLISLLEAPSSFQTSKTE